MTGRSLFGCYLAPEVAHALGFERNFASNWSLDMPVTRSQAVAAEQCKLEKKEGQESACVDNAFEKIPDELLLKVTIRSLGALFRRVTFAMLALHALS